MIINYLYDIQQIYTEYINMIFLVLIVFVFSTDQCALSQQYPTFPQFILQYQRNYIQGTPEYNFRQAIYNQRIANFSFITAYRPAVNNLTDRTPQQISKMKGMKISEKKPRSTPLRRSLETNSNPTSLDWRDKYAVTPAKNQGTCGACWAFTAAGYLQSYLILHYNLSKFDIDFSEQYILECTSGSTCEGGYVQSALKSILDYGVANETEFPYKPYESVYQICTKGQHLFSKDEVIVAHNDLTDEQLIGLLQHSPVPTTISSQGWENYGFGKLSCQQNARVDHGVLIIGYDQDSWLIKNSWGSSWGQYGYAKITRNRTNNCKIGNLVELFEAFEPLFELVLYMAVMVLFLQI